MYRMNRQMRIEDFVFPYGQLDKNNEWVKLADLVPWDEAEEAYAKQFVNNGHPAHPARIALGALIIKQRLQCSDEWTVRHVSENPYLQYFLGLKEYTSKCPFGASTMVEFRKRFPPEAIAALLAASTPKEDQDDHDDQNGGCSGENKGTLIMDSTCCPADISYPQDFQLLNEAREKLEHIVDVYCEAHKLKKPRMRRRTARKDYLKLSKCKKRTAKKTAGRYSEAAAIYPAGYWLYRGYYSENPPESGRNSCESFEYHHNAVRAAAIHVRKPCPYGT